MYVFGEAMSPSLCNHNPLLDCRTNASWFDESADSVIAWLTNQFSATPVYKELVGDQEVFLTPALWEAQQNGTWVHGLDAGVCDLPPGNLIADVLSLPTGSRCWANLTCAELQQHTP